MLYACDRRATPRTRVQGRPNANVVSGRALSFDRGKVGTRCRGAAAGMPGAGVGGSVPRRRSYFAR